MVRVEWIAEPVHERCLTVRAKAALRQYERHPVCAHYLRLYKEWRSRGSLDRKWKTAYTLLNADGLEVAIRPILYPHHAYGDSDLKSRLSGVHIKGAQQLHIRHGILRKLLSSCIAYHLDVK